jgi:hypothetical protein
MPGRLSTERRSVRNSLAAIQPLLANEEETRRLVADISSLAVSSLEASSPEAGSRPSYQEIVRQADAGNPAEVVRIRREAASIQGKIAADGSGSRPQSETLRADREKFAGG